MVLTGIPRSRARTSRSRSSTRGRRFTIHPRAWKALDDLRIFLRAVGRSEAAGAATDRDVAEFKQLRGRLRRVFETDDVAEAASLLNAMATESGAVPRLAPGSNRLEVRVRA